MRRAFFVLKTGDEAVASDDAMFEVTTVDLAGMVSEDVSKVVYSAVVEYLDTSKAGSCRVAYDSSDEKHQGTCTLPELLAGDFRVSVTNDRNDEFVGRSQDFVPRRLLL